MAFSPDNLLPFGDSELFVAIRDHKRASLWLIEGEQALARDGTDSPELLTAVEDAAVAERDSLRRLLAITPSTMEGLLALLSYMGDALRRDPHVLDDETAIAFAHNVSRAAAILTNYGADRRAPELF